jgi:hypothetical protein
VLAEDRRLGGTDDTVMRGVLRFKPSEDLIIDASIIRAKSATYGPAAVITALVPGTFQYQALNAQLVKRGLPALTANDPRLYSAMATP